MAVAGILLVATKFICESPPAPQGLYLNPTIDTWHSVIEDWEPYLDGDPTNSNRAFSDTFMKGKP